MIKRPILDVDMLPFSHFLSFSVAFQLTVRLKSLPSEAAMSRQTSAVFRRTALSVMTRWVVEFPSNEKSGWKLWTRPGRKRTTTSRSITACLAAMMQDEEEGIWIATVYFTQLSNSLSLPVFTSPVLRFCGTISHTKSQLNRNRNFGHL